MHGRLVDEKMGTCLDIFLYTYIFHWLNVPCIRCEERPYTECGSCVHGSDLVNSYL